MRNLGAVVSNLMTLGGIEYFFLVSLRGADHSTSLPYSITMSNGITYLHDNGLTSVEPPRLSTTVDRESYKIAFADPNFLMRSYFESGAVGDAIEVRVGFINPTDSPIVGSDGVSVAPDAPFLDIRHTILSYKGIVDNHGYNIDFGDKSVIATIEGSSPMADLDLVRVYYTSKESIKQFSATDTSYDQIYEGSEEIVIKWGKE
jgi:hypothetical protein